MNRKIGSTIRALRKEKRVSQVTDIQKLMRQDSDTSYISGFEGELCKRISEYIEKVTKRTVSVSNIRQTRMIMERFDQRLIDYMFSGQITFKDCKALLAVYDDIDLEQLLFDIKNKRFDINNYTIKKEKPTTSSTMSRNEVLGLLYDLKLGKITIKEAISRVEGE